MSAGRKAGSGQIRIVAGSLRNSRVHVPQLPGLRPTPERVRETLFNWLAPVIEGARCLDLCAGTGALGIEACSRGAASVQFVERDVGAAQALRENLVRLKVDAPVSTLDAAAFLRGPAQVFDVVFLDPPFVANLWAELAVQLETGGWLAANGLIYVESPRAVAPGMPANWITHREAQAGEVRLALYRRWLPLS